MWEVIFMSPSINLSLVVDQGQVNGDGGAI